MSYIAHFKQNKCGKKFQRRILRQSDDVHSSSMVVTPSSSDGRIWFSSVTDDDDSNSNNTNTNNNSDDNNNHNRNRNRKKSNNKNNYNAEHRIMKANNDTTNSINKRDNSRDSAAVKISQDKEQVPVQLTAAMTKSALGIMTKSDLLCDTEEEVEVKVAAEGTKTEPSSIAPKSSLYDSVKSRRRGTCKQKRDDNNPIEKKVIKKAKTMMTIEQRYNNNKKNNDDDDDDGYDGYKSWIEGNWRWILPLPHNISNNSSNNNNKTQAIQASEKNPDDDTADTAAAAAESNTKSGHQQRGRPPAKRSNQTSNTSELLSNDDGGDSKKDDDDEDTTTTNTSTNGIVEWVKCEDTNSNVEWVQCDKCTKWRKLPSDISTNKLLLDDDDNHWDCSMMKTWKNKQSVAVSSSSITAAAVGSYCDTDEDAIDAQHHEVGVSGWKLRQTHTGKYWYRQLEEQQKQKEDILSLPNDSDTSPRNININILVSKNGGKQQRRQPQQRSNRSTGNIGSISKEKATHKATTGDTDTDTDTDLLMKKAILDAHDYMLSKYGQAYVDEHNDKGEVVVMV